VLPSVACVGVTRALPSARRAIVERIADVAAYLGTNPDR
jgi:hypothetical protein